MSFLQLRHSTHNSPPHCLYVFAFSNRGCFNYHIIKTIPFVLCIRSHMHNILNPNYRASSRLPNVLCTDNSNERIWRRFSDRQWRMVWAPLEAFLVNTFISPIYKATLYSYTTTKGAKALPRDEFIGAEIISKFMFIRSDLLCEMPFTVAPSL